MLAPVPWWRRLGGGQLVLGTLAIALGSFVAGVVLGRELFALGVHREWDLLFDSDPLVYLKNFATGRTVGDWGGRSFIRPNLTNFVHLPLRALSDVLSWVGLGPAPELRWHLAFYVCPLVAALRVPVMVGLVRSLGIAPRWCLILATLDAVSFSTRLFASIPESHMITGTMLAALFWLGTHTARAPRPPRAWVWLVALFLVTGTSIVSIVPGAMIFFAAARRLAWGRRLAWTGALAGGALALNALLYEASRIVYRGAPHFHPIATEHVEHARTPGLPRTVDYVTSLANSYMPPPPATMPWEESANRRTYVFTFERADSRRAWDGRPVAFLALLALGTLSYPWLPSAVKPVHLTAFAILCFGAALHTFFGRELFLYAHHWKVAVTVLIAAVFHLPGSGRWLKWGIPLVVVAMAANNLLVIREILDTLART